MKTEISRDSHQPKKRYSGVYQQQGRMLTDADWNELVEILKDRLNNALQDVVGNGSAFHRNVVNNTTTPPTLQWGYVHVDGIQAEVRPDEEATLQPVLEYAHQLDFPGEPDLPTAPNNDYVYYVDVWERTVTHLMDERLRDKGLHGADTCTRKQIMAQVKWCNDTIDPEVAIENPAKGDAQLSITLLQKTTESDPCDPCAAQLGIESKLGNYLFRVEVHDVLGMANDPSEITLKWSSENAAEQYALKDSEGAAVIPPEEFISGQWVYEFFDEATEKHLGVHLATGFLPDREDLTEAYPVVVPSRDYVRRWDGYCTLIKNAGNWEVADQFDRSQSGSIEFSEIVAGILTVSLDTQTLVLTLNNSFVAGDYWLADVREAEHEAGSPLLTDEMPHGIEHHYLTLGHVLGGVLQDNPEADRKYAYPPLTEMTRLFMAGGDGQEVMPGVALPQLLRVAVANGERPVHGATVRFQIMEGGGSLHSVNSGITADDGIAECEWTPGLTIGEKYRVKATLVDPDNAGDASMDLDPPVYFYANLITADQVAYEPGCPDTGENAVHSLLADDANVPLASGDDGYYSVKEVLDVLLCHLNAEHLPIDRDNLCVKLASLTGDEQVNTVQDAINALCLTQQGGGCCEITILPDDDLATRLSTEVIPGSDVHICISAGEYTVKQPVLLEGLGHVTLEGCGKAAIIKAVNSESAILIKKCNSVEVRNLTMQSYKLGDEDKTEYDELNGTLTVKDVKDVVVESVTLICPHGGQKMSTCLTVAHINKTSSIRINSCRLNPGHQQVGMLITNAELVRLEDNEVKVRPRSRKTTLKTLLKNKAYRLTIRKMLLSDVVVVEDDVTGDRINIDKQRNVEFSYEGRLLRFQTHDDLPRIWLRTLARARLEKGLNNRDLLRAVKSVADKIILSLDTSGGATPTNRISNFDDWFNSIKSNLPAIASQGIVCAGRVENDICITENSIFGVAQGIHIGLSHEESIDKEPDIAGRLLITGNRVVTYISMQVLGEWHGIFTGNFECLHIENNHLELKRFPLNLNKPSVDGIRVYGYFGGMLQIRGNRLNGYDPGIFARAVNAEARKLSLWQIENNLLEGASTGPVLDPLNKFITSNNPH